MQIFKIIKSWYIIVDHYEECIGYGIKMHRIWHPVEKSLSLPPQKKKEEKERKKERQFKTDH